MDVATQSAKMETEETAPRGSEAAWKRRKLHELDVQLLSEEDLKAEPFWKAKVIKSRGRRDVVGIVTAVAENDEGRLYLVDYSDGSDDWLRVDEIFASRLSLNNRQQRHKVSQAVFEHLKKHIQKCQWTLSS